MGWELRHARTMDAEILIKEGDFLLSMVTFGVQSDTGVGAVGWPGRGCEPWRTGRS